MNAFHRPARRRAILREKALRIGERSPLAFGALSVLVLAAFLVAFAVNAHAALYKWTDERGVVHYSDKIPADAVNRASVELNRQGLAVRKTEQARTTTRPLAKSETEEQQARAAERAKLLAARRDRALIESYTSEAEIDLAKSRALATINGQIQSAQAFVSQMEKRRDELEAKKSTYAPRPVPGELKREIETIDAEVARQNNFIVSKQKELEMVAGRYDSDKQRFRELRETSGGVASAEGQVASTSAVQLTSGPARP
jgi:hypothetical protein